MSHQTDRIMRCFTPHDLLFSLLFFGFFAANHHACNHTDRKNLLSLFLLSAPSLPLNWSSIDCCYWEGISCDHNGQVTHIWLPSKGLKGSISRFLGNLTHLSHLNLSHNSLSGALPNGLFSSLNQLMILDLSHNDLSGDISLLFSSDSSSYGWSASIQVIDISSNYFNGMIQSSFLQRAQNLTQFNVSNNGFEGSIPSSLCNNSPIVRVFDFSFNDHTGQIPWGLGACSKVKIFRAGSNSLSGLLPNDIYSATTLEDISLPSNNLSGPISDDVGNLTKLTNFELYANHLSGELPMNIGKLSNLKILLLHTNSLSGSLPSSLMNCTNLIQLRLWNNLLEGNISNLNFSNLQQLTILDLGYNGFTGSFPASIQSCKSLRAFRVARNQLDGQIPPEVAQLKYLTFFSVASNNLTNITGAFKILMQCKILDILLVGSNFQHETFPTEHNLTASGAFENLRMLDFAGCQLIGQFPTWISKLKKLKVLNLRGNRITGSIPGWLSSALPRLIELSLGDNLISGEFSRELCLFPALALEQAPEDNDYFLLPLFSMDINSTRIWQHSSFSARYPTINLENNCLSGPIPIEIGSLKLLRSLRLGHNNFSGSIPDQISELTRLETLNLSGNHLSGKIPESLTRLNFLATFSVANNNLHGPIPTSTQLQSFDASAYEGNPGLCGSPLPRCGNNNSGDGIQNDEKDGHSISGFHISMIFGTITGFWGVCGPLAFHRKWRITYFQFMDNLKDRFMVILAVCLARMHREGWKCMMVFFQ